MLLSIIHFARICSFFIFSYSTHHQIAVETWSKNDVFFSSSEAKSRVNVPSAGLLQRSPSGVPPAGPPHQPGRATGGAAKSPKRPMHWSGPVYWHMTLPVHTVLARATRAQPCEFTYCCYCSTGSSETCIVPAKRLKCGKEGRLHSNAAKREDCTQIRQRGKIARVCSVG